MRAASSDLMTRDLGGWNPTDGAGVALASCRVSSPIGSVPAVNSDWYWAERFPYVVIKAFRCAVSTSARGFATIWILRSRLEIWRFVSSICTFTAPAWLAEFSAERLVR